MKKIYVIKQKDYCSASSLCKRDNEKWRNIVLKVMFAWNSSTSQVVHIGAGHI